MKKTIFAVLTVLLLSFILSGCGGLCEVCGEVPCICKAKSASAIPSSALSSLGISAGDVLVPEGTTYFAFEQGGDAILIYWKDANQAMFDYYEDAWKSRAVTDTATITEHTNGKFSKAQIMFEDKAGSFLTDERTYPAGTIMFSATKASQ